MSNVLIRGIDDDELRNIDEQAKLRGLSRNEYLRRLVTQPGAPRPKATRADWERFAELAQDLADEEVMKQAWS